MSNPELMSRFGPFFVIIDKHGRLRSNEADDPYVFSRMGPHDNHTKHGRRVVKAWIVVADADPTSPETGDDGKS